MVGPLEHQISRINYLFVGKWRPHLKKYIMKRSCKHRGNDWALEAEKIFSSFMELASKMKDNFNSRKITPMGVIVR